MISENAKYWILLTKAVGYNTPKIKKLYKKYHNIASFIEGGEREWRLCGILNSIDIERLSKLSMDYPAAVLSRCRALGYSVLTIDDMDYPSRLYNIYAPPAVLYIDGRLPDFDDSLCVGIVGTRRASRYGVANSYKIAYSLCKYGVTVVSGGALGVDCASHRGALAADGVTVCVRGCGINSRYLPDNMQMRSSIARRGAVISEYPPDEEPRPYYFPARNRIIAALSDGVLLIEAGEKSGSLITADLALEMGRELFALMGNNSPQNNGSNGRIKEGTAVPVTDFMDILAAFDRFNGDESEIFFDSSLNKDIDAVPVKKQPEESGGEEEKQPKPRQSRRKKPTAAPPKTKPNITLNGDSKLVFDRLTEEPVRIDIIADDLGISVSRALSALTFLEMNGLIRVLPGRYFALK